MATRYSGRTKTTPRGRQTKRRGPWIQIAVRDSIGRRYPALRIADVGARRWARSGRSARLDRHRRQAQAQTSKKHKRPTSFPAPPGSPPRHRRCLRQPPPFGSLTCGLRSITNLVAARRYAQTFTANGTGTIGAADVEISCVSAGTGFTVEIRRVDQNGLPTSEVLATAQLLNAPQVASPPTFIVTVSFTPPAPVEHGSVYALVLTDHGSPGYCAVVHSGDGCAGHLFVDPSASGMFTQVTNALVFALRP